jgi:hypothetical protein
MARAGSATKPGALIPIMHGTLITGALINKGAS